MAVIDDDQMTDGLLWYDGIIEGTLAGADEGAIDAAIHAINRSGIIDVALDIDGGHFSVLADDAPRSLAAVDDRSREALLTALQDLLDQLPDEATVESTLRCSECDGSEVRESLFAIVNGSFQAVGRSRPARPADLAILARHADSEPTGDALPFDRRLLPLVLVLIVAAGGIFLWQSGAIDRALAPTVDQMDRNRGPFEQLLDWDVTAEWGTYHITIKRGADYPVDQKKLDALLATTESMSDRAAINVVANGDTIYVRLVDKTDRVLVAKALPLRSLVTKEDGTEKVTMPGLMAGARLELALDDGLEKR